MFSYASRLILRYAACLMLRFAALFDVSLRECLMLTPFAFNRFAVTFNHSNGL